MFKPKISCEPNRTLNKFIFRQPRQSKRDQLNKLEQLIQKQTNSTQIEYGKLLGVAQSRISQLMKTLTEEKAIQK